MAQGDPGREAEMPRPGDQPGGGIGQPGSQPGGVDQPGGGAGQPGGGIGQPDGEEYPRPM